MTQAKTRKYFGTDGIRGRANRFPMTADMALKVAMAVAQVVKQDNSAGHQNRAVIGKDTRLSGYMLEQAMAAGFEAMGMDVIFLGPLPTPAIAMLTRSLRADVGVMISASHNPYEDNGIKLFGSDGYKLDDSLEEAVEALLETDMSDKLPSPDKLGKASRLDDAPGRYIEYIKSSFPRRHSLEGLKLVIDCGHGAGYKVGPQILWELEAEVISIGVAPDGRNINDGYGATATDKLSRMVIDHRADLGIALDGDADRLILVDERGMKVDGDQILALLGTEMKRKGLLQNSGVVATVMSNLGLEKYLENQDITLHRTGVGDRFVSERMREGGFNLGGEQSGHIIMSDFSTTGDGLLASLQVLAALKEHNKPASKVLQLFKPMPQILKNVRFDQGVTPLDKEDVKAEIKRVEENLKNSGRLLVRASGTEPVIRVMAEGENIKQVKTVVNDLCDFIARYAKSA